MKNTLLAIIETPAGGEEVAARALLTHLGKYFHSINIMELPSFSSAAEKNKALPYLRWLCSSLWRSMLLLIRYRNSSVIYTTTFTAGCAASLLTVGTQKKLFFHYHGNRIPEISPLSGRYSLRKLQQHYSIVLKHHLVKALHFLLFFRTSHVFTANERAKKYLKGTFSSIQSISVLQNGVDTSIFSPPSSKKKKTLRAKFHIPISHTVYLIISRLEPKKNILTSIQQYQSIQKKSRNTSLLLAYPKQGNTQEYVQEVLSVLATIKTAKVLFAYRKIEEVYQVADVMINHAFDETSQLTVLEALSTGIQIIGHTGLSASQRKRLSSHDAIRKSISWERSAMQCYQKMHSVIQQR